MEVIERLSTLEIAVASQQIQIAGLLAAVDRDTPDATVRRTLAESTKGLPFTASDLLRHAEIHPTLAAALTGADLVGTKQLGCWLHAMRGVRDGILIERQRGRRWRVAYMLDIYVGGRGRGITLVMHELRDLTDSQYTNIKSLDAARWVGCLAFARLKHGQVSPLEVFRTKWPKSPHVGLLERTMESRIRPKAAVGAIHGGASSLMPAEFMAALVALARPLSVVEQVQQFVTRSIRGSLRNPWCRRWRPGPVRAFPKS